MKTKIKSILLVLVISILTLFLLGNNYKTTETKSTTGIDIYVLDRYNNLVNEALVRVTGNGFEGCCYTSYNGECRIQVPQDGDYGFCASKDHYGDSKTVYISGGTAIVYMYLKTYGLECQTCENPEKH
ncbi:MAG: hypothetical protein L0Y76_11095 [Ignavibacteria bacterium]|nr:hypothetical protein [Ignavibacteria bacterium]